MAESGLLCVRLASLLRNKYASILRVMSRVMSHTIVYVRIVKIFYFNVLDICLALDTAQAKKKFFFN